MRFRSGLLFLATLVVSGSLIASLSGCGGGENEDEEPRTSSEEKDTDED